jgi:YteA family regulatory protein
MDREKLSYYKKKLICEKERISDLLLQMKRNETIDSNIGASSELSFYDNHPSDMASELEYREKGIALKVNEISILDKVEASLRNIEDGSYGTCKKCGKEIPRERLDFLPYADQCINCKEIENRLKPREIEDRPVEEVVLGMPFGYGFNDFSDDTGYDAEDCYQDVEGVNRLRNIEEYYEEDSDYVEPIERISNEQYKNQLPD